MRPIPGRAGPRECFPPAFFVLSVLHALVSYYVNFVFLSFSCEIIEIKRILSVDFTLKTRYKDTSVSALLSLEDNV